MLYIGVSLQIVHESNHAVLDSRCGADGRTITRGDR